jgi:glyoxylase-like metal-dependent hydrolase (beta-lactamase superfamily II)
MDRGSDPRKVFESVLATGRTMNATSGEAFYADVQKFPLTGTTTLYCFQLPCGGSIFLIRSGDDMVMVDTGYGIYHHDIMKMLPRYGVTDISHLSHIVVTHADADHCGAAGFFTVPVFMHTGTLEIIRTNNRGYGSRNEDSVLEAFYTKMINLFSKFNTPSDIRCFEEPSGSTRGIFPVIGTLETGGITFEVLESLGGHTFGQVFLYSREEGLLFAADSVINFASLSKERADYSSLAAFLVTSVNVDSERATKERRALLELAKETDEYLKKSKKRCLICGGHGAVSVLENGKLVAAGQIERYEPGK